MPERIPGLIRQTVAAHLPDVVLFAYIVVVVVSAAGMWRVESIANEAHDLGVTNQRLLTEITRLASENEERIDDIQDARSASCRQTYEGVREVFRPFFRSSRNRTPEERRDIRRFNTIIDERKATCDRQTRSSE